MYCKTIKLKKINIFKKFGIWKYSLNFFDSILSLEIDQALALCLVAFLDPFHSLFKIV